jgi:hypothetical protein
MMPVNFFDQVLLGRPLRRVLTDQRDLMKLFPSEPMRMWPISTRVNKPENGDPSIVEPIELATDAA